MICMKSSHVLNIFSKVLNVKIPLILEIYYNKISDVRLAISMSQSMDFFKLYKDKSYIYPLSFAVSLERYDIVKLMLSKGKGNPNYVVNSSLSLYSDPKERIVTYVVINRHKMFEENGWMVTPTTVAFIDGKFQILSLLYTYGGRVKNRYSFSLIRYFLENSVTRNRHICGLLIKHQEFDLNHGEQVQFQRVIEEVYRRIQGDTNQRMEFEECVRLLVNYGFLYEGKNVLVFKNNHRLIKILNLDREYIKQQLKHVTPKSYHTLPARNYRMEDPKEAVFGDDTPYVSSPKYDPPSLVPTSRRKAKQKSSHRGSHRRSKKPPPYTTKKKIREVKPTFTNTRDIIPEKIFDNNNNNNKESRRESVYHEADTYENCPNFTTNLGFRTPMKMMGGVGEYPSTFEKEENDDDDVNDKYIEEEEEEKDQDQENEDSITDESGSSCSSDESEEGRQKTTNSSDDDDDDEGEEEEKNSDENQEEEEEEEEESQQDEDIFLRNPMYIYIQDMDTPKGDDNEEEDTSKAKKIEEKVGEDLQPQQQQQQEEEGNEIRSESEEEEEEQEDDKNRRSHLEDFEFDKENPLALERRSSSFTKKSDLVQPNDNISNKKKKKGTSMIKRKVKKDVYSESDDEYDESGEEQQQQQAYEIGDDYSIKFDDDDSNNNNNNKYAPNYNIKLEKDNNESSCEESEEEYLPKLAYQSDYVFVKNQRRKQRVKTQRNGKLQRRAKTPTRRRRRQKKFRNKKRPESSSSFMKKYEEFRKAELHEDEEVKHYKKKKNRKSRRVIVDRKDVYEKLKRGMSNNRNSSGTKRRQRKKKLGNYDI